MLTWLVPDFDLLSVLLRAASFSFEALLLGGLIFLIFDAAPVGSSQTVQRHLSRVTASFALGFAVIQVLSATVSITVLLGTTDLHLGEAITADYFVAESILIGIALLLCALLLSTNLSRSSPVYLLLGLILLGASASLSHAASRLHHRGLLLLFDGLHHLGIAAWIGAMPHLFMALGRAEGPGEARRMLRRFTALAVSGVLLLSSAGIGMSWFYVGSVGALYGTSYGVMLSAKIVLFLVALSFGTGNYFLTRGMRMRAAGLLQRLRCLSEVEVAIGFTVFLVAASLTSQAPAVDLVKDRLSSHEIMERFEWRWPSFETPDIRQLRQPPPIATDLQNAIASSVTPIDRNDRIWSGYNHNWAGLIVVAAGIVALLARIPRQDWARSWPLLFMGLAGLILLRADPENWPLGPRSFWESFSAPDVLEHRMYALLITVFAVFEWGVETARLKSQKASLVFPAICCIGGALLMTHSHSLGNVKDETLAEMSHTPIALLGIVIGASRWLELRVADHRNTRGIVRLMAWVWPISLIAAGLVLLDYREL